LELVDLPTVPVALVLPVAVLVEILALVEKQLECIAVVMRLAE
jgi:hypothetical protein